MGEFISFTELRKRIAEHLNTTMGITEFDTTFAKLYKKSCIWRVNVSYKLKPDDLSAMTSLFGIDAKTGEIIEFQRDRYWTF